MLDWEWWDDQNTRILLLTILLSVNHEPKRWHGITVDAGEMITSYAALAQKSGLSYQSVRTSLEHLISTHEVTCESTHQFTRIKVVKWADFQSLDSPPNIPTNMQPNRPLTEHQQSTNNKQECKNDKNDKKEEKDKGVDYQHFADMYNEICVSFPRVRSISESRKKAIKARLRKHSEDDFRMLFEKAEASDFLKGDNSRNWSATFDWLINDSNMAKVLDGNYDNRSKKKKEITFDDIFNERLSKGSEPAEE